MALTNKLTAIADGFRQSRGTEDKYTLEQMAVLAAEPTGGNEPTAEELTITGGCNYRFAYDGWSWFLNKYGNKITTKDIVDFTYMFNLSKNLTEIPFDINLSSNFSGDFTGVFSYASNLTEAPLIVGNLNAATSDYNGNPDISSVFASCYSLRYIPHNYFTNFGGTAFWESVKNYKAKRDRLFSDCYSLRQLPDISMLPTSTTSSSSTLYYYLCYYAKCIDEIVDLPVLSVTLTSSAFSGTASYCNRLKNFTFATNEDGTAKTANWKSQIIDLSQWVGYYYSNTTANTFANNVTKRQEFVDSYCYNSGITEDKLIYNDETYQRLKDDPDSFAVDAGQSTGGGYYSRYNHDSAVATINSLPDTKAYLETAGGTNTIKFKGASGSNTDGGAINTLTEAEIAVAAAKGWTVTLV